MNYKPLYDVFVLNSRLPREARRIEYEANQAWLAENYDLAARLFEAAATIRQRIERPRYRWGADGLAPQRTWKADDGIAE